MTAVTDTRTSRWLADALHVAVVNATRRMRDPGLRDLVLAAEGRHIAATATQELMGTPPEPPLTMPADHFCPSCGVHNRAQDTYSGPHVLMPMCPVCEDIERRAEQGGAA